MGCRGVGWVYDSIPSKCFGVIVCYTGDMWTSVVLMEMHSFCEHALPPVLNGMAKLLQSLTVAGCIDCCTGRHEFAQRSTPYCPKKTLAITLLADGVCLNIHGVSNSGCFHWQDCCFVSGVV